MEPYPLTMCHCKQGRIYIGDYGGTCPLLLKKKIICILIKNNYVIGREKKFYIFNLKQSITHYYMT